MEREKEGSSKGQRLNVCSLSNFKSINIIRYSRALKMGSWAPTNSLARPFCIQLVCGLQRKDASLLWRICEK